MIDTETPEWATSPVAAFVHQANENSAAFFLHQPNNSALVERVNKIFLDAIGLLEGSLELVSNFLLFRAHSLYLTSVRAMTAGQAFEPYVLMRACLESGLYGLHVFTHPGDAEVWLHRNDDEESTSTMRSAFKNWKLLEEVGQIDRPLQEAVQALYERTIELGAHPNPMGILSMAEWIKDDKGIRYEGVYITNDPVRIGASMAVTLRVAVATLRLFRHVHLERFDIMGLSAELDQLSRGL